MAHNVDPFLAPTLTNLISKVCSAYAILETCLTYAELCCLYAFMLDYHPLQ